MGDCALQGGELYVRARIVSSKHKEGVLSPDEMEQAWTAAGADGGEVGCEKRRLRSVRAASHVRERISPLIQRPQQNPRMICRSGCGVISAPNAENRTVVGNFPLDPA